jgi:hypothetical protein
MSQSKGFDMSKMSTASKILLGGGILYFIDLFLQWQRVCFSVVGASACGGVNGIHGIGILNMLIVLAIIGMEVILLAGMNVDMGTPQMRSTVEAGLAGALLVFTLLKILIDNDFISWPSYLGVVLAIVIAYGGWMRWQESKVSGGMTGGSSMGDGTPS